MAFKHETLTEDEADLLAGLIHEAQRTATNPERRDILLSLVRKIRRADVLHLEQDPD